MSGVFSKFDFNPSANGTLDNMKYGGINISEIIQELKDNTDDAKSTLTKILLIADGDDLLRAINILDNGRGMSEEELCKAIVLGHRSHHTQEDIGKFGLGLKNATIGAGDEIALITKKEGCPAIGIFMDIQEMRSRNSFKPTLFESDAQSLRSHLSPSMYEQFEQQSSGTLIVIKQIHPHHVSEITNLSSEIKQALTFNYSNTTNTVNLSTSLNPEGVVITPFDIFYTNSPEKLESYYDVKMHVFKVGKSNVVYEECMKDRKWSSKQIKKNKIYKFNPLAGKRANSPAVYEKVDSLPDGPSCIFNVRFVDVKAEVYKEESATGGLELLGDRKAFSFERGSRMVARNMSIGLKLDPWYNYLRAKCTFPPELDLYFGVRTQKQMGNEIHSEPISDALKTLWGQFSTYCIKKRKIKEENEQIEEPATVRIIRFNQETTQTITVETTTTPDTTSIELASSETTEPISSQTIPVEDIQITLETEIHSNETETTLDEIPSNEPKIILNETETTLDEIPSNEPKIILNETETTLDEIPSEPETTTVELSVSHVELILHSETLNTTLVKPETNLSNSTLLESWISQQQLPANKTHDDLMKHICSFWNN